MDLSKLSNEDLLALRAGDLSKVSNDGLLAMRGKSAPSEAPEESFVDKALRVGRGAAQGVADQAIGLWQLRENLDPAKRLFAPEIIKHANDFVREQDKDYEQSRGASAGTFDPSRMAGGVVGPLSAFTIGGGATVGAAGRLAQGAAGGFLGGVTNPVTDEDYGSAKAGQVVAGTVLGTLLPGAWELAKGGGRLIRNIIEPSLGKAGAERSAGRLANEAAGSRKEDVIAALAAAKARETAGQASVPAGSAEFAALTEIAAKNKPSEFVKRAGEQQSARAAAIGGIAGTPEELAKAKLDRGTEAKRLYGEIKDRKVDPRSEQQIVNARVRAAEERTQAAKDTDFVPVPGMPRVTSGYNPEVARKAADEAELKSAVELLRESIGFDNKSFGALYDRPSIQEAVAAAQRGARESGGYFPKKAGEKFSVENLQTMKQYLDDVIKDPAASGLKASDAARVSRTRDSFVDWLSSAVPEWRDARVAYKEASKPINQKIVGAELEKALTSGTGKERVGAFTSAVDNATRIPELQRKSGAQRFGSLDEVLTPEQMATVQGVKGELVRDVELADLAQAGMPKALNLVGDISKVPTVGMIDRVVTIVNALANRAAGKGGQKTMDALSDLSLEPGGLAEAMRKATPFQRSQIIDALMRAQGVSAGQAQ